ncbi:bacterial transcriptional activator domain-containing protein [Glycomyces sp. NRRL B-16210]|uniref:AfsR/SARP family transcriptional regulator n=1 Tax=Glycomyces sp. NRRL B-16210 TaxID=1463821 RepID=UPI0004C1AC34|nr:bacterial transcriptional activator domain-containing protein [Glycomyces sp. NRRL B-16210]
MPPLLLITDDPHEDVHRLTEALKHDLVNAVILGAWESAELTIAADGTITERHPDDTTFVAIDCCYIADPHTLNETLDLTTPTATAAPRPEPDAAPHTDTTEATTPPAPALTAPAESEQPRLILLGTPALLWQGTPIRWRRRSSLLLLAALAAAPDGCRLDDLLETVVGDGHDITKARGHLGTVTSDTRRDFNDATGLNLRAVLHDDQTDRYRLHPDITTDLTDFHHHRHPAATAATDPERIDHLTHALAAYGGDFATGLEDDWLDTTRTELRQAAYTTCLHLAALHRDADDLEAATTVPERATAIDRTRPEAWTTLIETRTAAGDEVGAQKARRGQRLWTSGDHNTAPM